MKRLSCFAVSLLFILKLSAQNKPDSLPSGIYKWFKAWELTAKEYGLPAGSPPIFLFYDQQFVYSTSTVSIPDGSSIQGPMYFTKKLYWRVKEHTDSIRIPDGSVVPVDLMTFAAPLDSLANNSFFVMAAPEYWKNAHIKTEIALELFITGVFMHEFAHTRQMKNYGVHVSKIENTHLFSYPVSDDIVQDYFQNDSAYVKLFKKEVENLYKAAFATERDSVVYYTKLGLKYLHQRHQQFLQPTHKALPELDKIFLTMEGMGQFSFVHWLRNREGGGIEEKHAIQVARRGKNWFSQDEGLALMLIYEKLEDSNFTIFFDEETENIVDMLLKLTGSGR